jgi:hypothetical protein
MEYRFDFESVPLDVMREIVSLVAKSASQELGEEGAIEQASAKLRTLKMLALTSKGARAMSLGLMGYVLSLAPRVVVPTGVILKMMRHVGVRSQVLLTASSPKSAELLARIADLTPAVIEALRAPLQASLARATVRGAAMYSGDPGAISALTERIIARLKDRESDTGAKMNRPYPKVKNAKKSVSEFLGLSAPERTKLAEDRGPLCLWDVSECTDLDGACANVSFSSDLYWDTSQCTSMVGVFRMNREFRGDLSTWDVSSVEKMDHMFRGSGVSDSGIGNWDVGSVVSAGSMFADASALSPDLDFAGWNVGSAVDLGNMFRGSAIRDGGIGKWRINPAADTKGMFAGTKFAGDLEDWPIYKGYDATVDAGAPSEATAERFGQTRRAARDALVAREFAKIARRRSSTRREGACSVM